MADLEILLQLQEMNVKLAQVRESCRNRNLQKAALSESIQGLKLVEQTIYEICPGINPSQLPNQDAADE